MPRLTGYQKPGDYVISPDELRIMLKAIHQGPTKLTQREFEILNTCVSEALVLLAADEHIITEVTE